MTRFYVPWSFFSSQTHLLSSKSSCNTQCLQTLPLLLIQVTEQRLTRFSYRLILQKLKSQWLLVLNSSPLGEASRKTSSEFYFLWLPQPKLGWKPLSPDHFQEKLYSLKRPQKICWLNCMVLKKNQTDLDSRNLILPDMRSWTIYLFIYCLL